MSKPSDLIQGTLDLLILKTLSLEPKHGWAIAKRIEQVSNDALQITQGALYPGPASSGAAGLDSRQVAHHRNRARSEVLRTDRQAASSLKKNWRSGSACRMRWDW